jgi:serine/threonine-protein kinase
LGVTDFGIASVAYDTSVTRTGEVMGTAAYISPEQAAGEPAGAASDRYALAVVAYELLTGVRPFAGGSFAAQARQHLEETPDPPSHKAEGDLPSAVDPVLLRALSKDPDDRWSSGAEMAAALETALADEVPTERTVAMAPTEATEAMARPAPTPARPAPARPAPARARPTPAPQSRPPTPERLRKEDRSPWFMGAAVAVAALVAVVILAALLGGGGEPASTPSERPATTPAPTTSTPAPAATQAQTTPEEPAVDDGRSISDLDAEGYGLIQAGRYEEAIPLERAAVRKCGDSTEVQCAYALFNLGTALNRAGRPEEAIPYLERRLEISNDRPSIVQAELDRARAAAGQGGGNGRGNGRGDEDGN